MKNIYSKNVSLLFLFQLMFLINVMGQEGAVIETTSADSLAYDEVIVSGSPQELLKSTSISFGMGSGSTISGDEINQNYQGSMTNALIGLVPGLFINEGTGEPGNTSGSLSIRGYGSYFSREIVVFIDGFESDISYLESLSPKQIESVNFLKDAGTLANFGMHGANGIIWVTTNRGTIGKTKIDLQFKSGIQQLNDINKPLNASDYTSLFNEANSNDNGMIWSPVYDPNNQTNVDWFDEVLKEKGQYTQTDLSFSGGNAYAKYNASLGYMNIKGLYDVPTDDKTANAEQARYNLRINTDFKVGNVVEGKVDLGGVVDDRKSPNISQGDLWNNLTNYPNFIYPVTNDNGSWTGTTIFPNNPVAAINATGYNTTHNRMLQARFYLKEKLDALTPGLYLEQAVNFNTWTTGSYDRTKNYVRYIGDVIQTTDEATNFGIQESNGLILMSSRQFLTGAGYSKVKGGHEVNTTLNFMMRTNFVNMNLNGAAGVQTTYNYMNLGGVFNYQYNKKYIAQLGFAYSGSDNYAPDNRFGFYPSLSLGWNLAEESFLVDNNSINRLKLRASLGQTGNDDNYGFRRYLYQEYYTANPSGQFQTGVSNLSGANGRGLLTANNDFFAEQSLKYDVGIDAELFNKLTFSIDGFMDKRSNILTLDNTYLAVYGNLPPILNVGEVTIKGLEGIFTYKDQIGDFGYSLSANGIFSKNTIDYMAEIPLYENARVTGNAIGTQFGYESDGLYDIDDFNPDGSLTNGLAIPTFGPVQPGDIKYKDIKNDGFINESDFVRIGKPYFPTTSYAFNINMNFKGFDIRILLQGVAGNEVNLLDISNQIIPFADDNNAYPLIKERWAYYPGQNIDTRAAAKFPRLSTKNNLNNEQNSAFWLKKGDYFKVRNVELGYTLPQTLVENISLSRVRIYFNAINLMSFSYLEDNYGIDPENLAGYPAVKTFTAGIRVNL